MEQKLFDLERYAACARQVCAEGAVLLRNEEHALPLTPGTRVAVFGRNQMNYYKSGSGSGGAVNVRYTVDIWDALYKSGVYTLNSAVRSAYEAFMAEHPYDRGSGWGQEPCSQKEMPLTEELVARAKEESDAALILLGRTAGEDADNQAAPGSYYLTEEERAVLKTVCSAFPRSIVLLNTGNVIDMQWVEEYRPGAVLYVWQGGQEGGNGVLDVLSGAVNPCGKLPDTIVKDLRNNPVLENDGGENRNVYAEDIYVGYRYFESFARDAVQYPFGFGLSYTSFDVALDSVEQDADRLLFGICVTNTGSCSGKEVVQVYVEKPQGALGQPLRQLCGYQKTSQLASGSSEQVEVSVPWRSLGSYDDSGVTGHKSCYVLEPGKYRFYVGTDVRSAPLAETIVRPVLTVLEELEEALAPVSPFRRLKPSASMMPVWEDVPLQSCDPVERREIRRPKDITQTGDQGYRLSDVESGAVSMESFIAQLSDEDLCVIMRGEGMCSPRVTPGTGGAIGGVSDNLQAFGIPAACCTDGPSGIRMDCGTKAFFLPSGTCMSCTFNEALIEELYAWEGMELRMHKIDMLLGPGLNIHRSPLCGRNFEYFSEDPLLSGKMASAQLRGMHRYGVTGVIKHFACNSQEHRRNFVDAVVSERALREIYLRGFEIAVKEGKAISIMTSYNPINGVYASSNYDLLTTILRKEWGFDGIVMTDWWAKGGNGIADGNRRHTACMARAQNDLSMVMANAEQNSDGDDTLEGIHSKIVYRGEIQRNAANICRTILRLPVYLRSVGTQTDLDRALEACRSQEDAELANAKPIHIMNGSGTLPSELVSLEPAATSLFQVFTEPRGIYRMEVSCHAGTKNALAQMSLSVFQGNMLKGTMQLTGKDQTSLSYSYELFPSLSGSFYLKLYCGQPGMILDSIDFRLEKNMEAEFTATLNELLG